MTILWYRASMWLWFSLQFEDEVHSLVITYIGSKLFYCATFRCAALDSIFPPSLKIIIIISANCTKWMAEIMCSFDVCLSVFLSVCAQRNGQSDQFKTVKAIRTSNLTCMSPGTVQTWPVKKFSKRGRLQKFTWRRYALSGAPSSYYYYYY